MILQCNEYWKRLDAESKPALCPFCGGEGGFAQIKITDKSGKELTYKEHIERLRKYYLAHLPKGISRKEIMAMSLNELEDMADIWSEF